MCDSVCWSVTVGGCLLTQMKCVWRGCMCASCPSGRDPEYVQGKSKHLCSGFLFDIYILDWSLYAYLVLPGLALPYTVSVFYSLLLSFLTHRMNVFRLAMLEGICATAGVLRNFDISLGCDPAEVKLLFSFTTKMSKLPLTLTRRWRWRWIIDVFM